MTVLQKISVLAVLAALILLVYLLKPILAPFLVGMLIAYLGDPLVDLIERKGLSRSVGVTIVFLVLAAIIVGMIVIVLPLLAQEATNLIRRIPDFVAWLQATSTPLVEDLFGIRPEEIPLDGLRQSLAQNWQQASGFVTDFLKEITRSGVAMVTWFANLALVPVVAFYMMRDWDILMANLRSMIPRDREDQIVGMVSECDQVLSAFLRGQLMIMGVLGCCYALGLWVVGLDLAIIIGLMSGLASVVPYLGFFVGIAAASLAALFQFQDAIHLVYVAIVFGIGQALEGWVLTPWLVGDRIGLHPVAVIFAILAGGQLFGFVGVLLALPAAAVIMVFIRHLHRQYKESELYASEAEENLQEEADG